MRLSHIDVMVKSVLAIPMFISITSISTHILRKVHMTFFAFFALYEL